MKTSGSTMNWPIVVCHPFLSLPMQLSPLWKKHLFTILLAIVYHLEEYYVQILLEWYYHYNCFCVHTIDLPCCHLFTILIVILSDGFPHVLICLHLMSDVTLSNNFVITINTNNLSCSIMIYIWSLTIQHKTDSVYFNVLHFWAWVVM